MDVEHIVVGRPEIIPVGNKFASPVIPAHLPVPVNSLALSGQGSSTTSVAIWSPSSSVKSKRRGVRPDHPSRAALQDGLHQTSGPGGRNVQCSENRRRCIRQPDPSEGRRHRGQLAKETSPPGISQADANAVRICVSETQQPRLDDASVAVMAPGAGGIVASDRLDRRLIMRRPPECR
jgi:hypothetical protein